MPLRIHALNAANIADKLTREIRTKEIGGQKGVFIPIDEASAMKDQLVAISHTLNDIADSHEGGN